MTDQEKDCRERQKTAIRQFLFDNSEEVTIQEMALVSRAESGINLRYVHGWHQTYAVGADANGNVIERPNSEQKIGRSSICAERLMLIEAEHEGRTIEMMVVVRRQRPDEGRETHIVSPCGDCRECIAHHNPSTKVIIWIGGVHNTYRKISILFLLPLQYKEKEKPGTSEVIAPNLFEK